MFAQLYTDAAVLSQAVTDPTGNGGAIVTTLGGYGLAGTFLIMLVFGYGIQPTHVYKRDLAAWERERAELKAEIDENKRDLKAAQKTIIEDVTPKMLQFAIAQSKWGEQLDRADQARIRQEAREEAARNH